MIILIGMCFCSPISAVFALLGSVISTLTALGLGASSASVYAGLWGYSASLTSIAIGGMFFVMNSYKTLVYAVLAACYSGIVHGAIASLLTPFGLPALTFPFVFVSWMFCLAGNSIKGLFPVEITAITIPEDHIKRINLAIKVTSKFNILNNIAVILKI